MSKCIFVAGASGAIGRRLSPLLVSSGCRVVGATRSAQRKGLLLQMGVEPAVIDVFDSAGLKELLAEIRPDVVIHQLTDLVAAAVQAGAKRLIAESIAFIYAEGPTPHTETDPLLGVTDPVYGGTVAGVMSLERQVIEAPLDGIVLRYGFFYGPGTGFDRPIASGSVHVDAAAKAAELAVTRGQPGIYNVAETGGAVNCTKAIQSLGWDANWRADQ